MNISSRARPAAHALAPPGLPRRSLSASVLACVDRLIERGQEAVLAVDEHVVEGLPRDLRPADDLRDRHARIAHLLDRLDRRREHPAALDLGDLAAWQPVRPGPQPRAAARVFSIEAMGFSCLIVLFDYEK